MDPHPYLIYRPNNDHGIGVG